MGITYKNKIPYLEEQNLVELTNSIRTPFYVYSQKKISDTFIQLKKKLNKDIYFSIKANSKQGVYALEFETPFKKNDLVRFKDDYGRQQKSYEGKKFTKNIGSRFIKFKKPRLGTKQTYKINKVKISLEVHKNFKKLIRNKMNTIFGILDGAIVDRYGRSVLSYGDIIRTNDLKTLSEVFKIKKYLSVVKVL